MLFLKCHWTGNFPKQVGRVVFLFPKLRFFYSSMNRRFKKSFIRCFYDFFLFPLRSLSLLIWHQCAVILQQIPISKTFKAPRGRIHLRFQLFLYLTALSWAINFRWKCARISAQFSSLGNPRRNLAGGRFVNIQREDFFSPFRKLFVDKVGKKFQVNWLSLNKYFKFLSCPKSQPKNISLLL